jgi:Mg-chelatase subunit ChlD
LLRRGRAREQEFPPAALVPPLTSTARQRSHLEDYPLLVLRAAMIVCLAVLGATPLVRCDRLSLTREHGASVALAIVLDDSLSMRARSPKRGSKWDLAKEGAGELLRAARPGDAVALVLAGKPARVALAATSDLAAARRALDDLTPSDRSTDLTEAVNLARAALQPLPQEDRRVVVLSDLAGDPLPEGTPAASTPLEELARPVSNCGIASAELRGRRATVAIACSSDAAAEGRKVELVVVEARKPSSASDGGQPASVGSVVDRADLAHHSGEQIASLNVTSRGGLFEARLTGGDDSAHDDTAEVSEEASVPIVSVVADSATASAQTGGATLIEQALGALGDSWGVRPLPLLPDDEKGFDGVNALVIDDPRGFSPETRVALSGFLSRGGVALALVGPRGAATDLGLSLEPFARGAVRWEPGAKPGIATDSVAWLGPEAASLSDLAERGRARLDGAELDGTRVAGTWSDGVPWITERRLGRGLCLTAGLPSSLDQSDLALRPGFLALLDHALKRADQLSGARRTVAGSAWVFSEAEQVRIDGPEGPVIVKAERSSGACIGPASGCSERAAIAVPAVRGRYTVRIDQRAETRTVTIDPTEITTPPQSVGARAAAAARGERAPIDASADVAGVLIALFAAELGLRALRRWGRRRPGPHPSAGRSDTGRDPVPEA